MAGFVMGYFTESPRGDATSWSLHLALSEDGLEWMPLNQNHAVVDAMIPQHGMRDPCFIRLEAGKDGEDGEAGEAGEDGGFVVLATDQRNWTEAYPTIHIWDTSDFVEFENERTAKLHDTPMHTFSPDAFWDPEKERYGVIWSGNTDRNRVYVNYTRDFVEFGPHELYFDPGTDCVDPTVVAGVEDGVNVLYYCDAANRKLHGSRSDSLAPGSFEVESYTGPIGTAAIASPMLFESLGGGTWYLWGIGPDPRRGRFEAWTTKDIAAGEWKPVDPGSYTQPANARQATVLPLTRGEMDRLVEVWGKPDWRRFRCLGDPSLFLRHYSYVARVSAYPFDPYEDMMWMMRAGLADRDKLSLESVNFPGRYLRARDGKLVLDEEEDTAEFAASATFEKVAGLADDKHCSFRLAGGPDRYILHRDGEVRVAAVKTPEDRVAATFQMVY